MTRPTNRSVLQQRSSTAATTRTPLARRPRRSSSPPASSMTTPSRPKPPSPAPKALPVHPLRQPHGRRLEAPPGCARRRRSLPRDRDRHGRGACRHAEPPEDRRPRGGLPRPVRLVPLDRVHAAAALRHHHRVRGRRGPGRLARALATPAAMVLLEIAVQPDARDRRHPRGQPTSRTPPAPWSSWTTCSPRRCCRSRSSSAPTSSSIPAPSTSTARAACSAAPCWAARHGSRRRCSPSSATPAPAVALQRLAAAQGHGDAAPARRRPPAPRPPARRCAGRPPRDRPRLVPGPRGPPAARPRHGADERRRHDGGVRAGRPGRRLRRHERASA